METWMTIALMLVLIPPTIIVLLSLSSRSSSGGGGSFNVKRAAIYVGFAIICFCGYLTMFSFNWGAVLSLALLSAIVIIANIEMGVDTVPKIKTWAIAEIIVLLVIIAVHEYSSIKTVEDLRSSVSQAFAATPQPTPPPRNVGWQKVSIPGNGDPVYIMTVYEGDEFEYISSQPFKTINVDSKDDVGESLHNKSSAPGEVRHFFFYNAPSHGSKLHLAALGSEDFEIKFRVNSR